MFERSDTQTISEEAAVELSLLIGLDSEPVLEADNELDRRSSNGIDVRLLRRPENDSAYVMVHDTTTGDQFSLDVQEGQSALDVFHHPFAYRGSAGSIAVEQAVE